MRLKLLPNGGHAHINLRAGFPSTTSMHSMLGTQRRGCERGRAGAERAIIRGPWQQGRVPHPRMRPHEPTVTSAPAWCVVVACCGNLVTPPLRMYLERTWNHQTGVSGASLIRVIGAPGNDDGRGHWWSFWGKGDGRGEPPDVAPTTLEGVDKTAPVKTICRCTFSFQWNVATS